MIDKIKWEELKPYENDKRRSFEELCYHIANRLYQEKRRLISVDDSGGGDGVEFYLTLPNEDEWGWQAKFYYPNKRLSNSRKQSIINSLKKACEVHPNLKKWILCTPTNFTQNEQDWFDSELPNSIPEDMNVKLKHWGDSKFNSYFSDPNFKGLPSYFFGELELDLDWFITKFENVKDAVDKKFEASLHTETRVDTNVHALLGDEAFANQIAEWNVKLEGELSDLKDAINKLNSPIPYVEWNEAEKLKVINAAESLHDSLLNINVQLKQARNYLVERDLARVQSIDWKSVLDQLYKTYDNYQEVVKESGTEQMNCTTEKQYEDQVFNYAWQRVNEPRYLIGSLLENFFQSTITLCKLINQPDLHIFGDAGTGKTHSACNICNDRIENGLPAIYIRGIQFTTDQVIKSQLIGILDIPRTCNWKEFLQALSAAAEAYQTRIPIIIDGLNESIVGGTFSRIWENGLKEFAKEISQTKNVVLVTTCRTSYKKVIWKDGGPSNSVNNYGFDTEELTQKAIEKYFKEYKIVANLTLTPLTLFKDPIYLKIFCETKNRERKSEVQVYIGEQSLFEVFEEYLKHCNTAICNRLRLRQGSQMVLSALDKMAAYLWQNRTRHIPVNEFISIVGDQPLNSQDWFTSKTHAIEAEGLLLVYRDMIDGIEVIRFTYDLLGGYLIAQYLVHQASNRRKIFLQRVVSNLFGKDRRVRSAFPKRIRNLFITLFPRKLRQLIYTLGRNKTPHPMYEDIGRCLAALLPSTNQYLHNLSKNPKAFECSIRGLFEISTDDINDECLNLVKALFASPQNRASFFKLAESTVGHPNHPFKASFWSDQLSTLSMVERDLSWSEHVRLYREKFEELLIRFETTCQSDHELSDIGKERLHLIAEYIMWILTSTVRPLRDQATSALYWYGRRFPQEFFDLVIKSFTINDPYVSERMLAATYGIAMARQNDNEDTSFVDEMLPKYAKQLYESMFKPKAPHATTHILARDYAKRTIDITLIHHPTLLSDDARGRITPPFTDGGIREWGECEKREEVFPPIQMDFDIYTLDRLKKYDAVPGEHERIKGNVYWRIYELGFTNESFVEIDGRISDENWRYGRYNEHEQKIDRYGKKYSWIAFFELAGFRQDNGLLPDRYEDTRISDADIDPSFPVEVREHKLVTEDFLGNREASTKQWISDTSHPNLTSYLKVDQLCNKQGSWVLLHGNFSQEDKQVSRDLFAWIQGVIVKSEGVDETVNILKQQEKIDGHTLPSYPGDYRTYAGEIPWCDTYPQNKWEELSLKTGSECIQKPEMVLERNGVRLSEQEQDEFWNSVKDLTAEDNFDTFLERLCEQSIEYKIEFIEIEKSQYQTIEVLSPVRENCWEGSCSVTNPHRSIAIPTREIVDSLGLCGCPQSFDLFEKDGRCASVSFRYGEKYGNMQHFAYLRKDLLERYLAEIDAEIIWVIWGNRRQVSQNINDPYENFQEVKTYRDIR